MLVDPVCADVNAIKVTITLVGYTLVLSYGFLLGRISKK